ncbi:MAG TPA: acetate--CoA ligase [Candidatus Dormibacteraeota bacterium]
MSVDTGVEDLISRPMLPLGEHRLSTAQAADLATARALEAESPDRYWEWAAGHLRWMEPWTALREGGFPEFRYFAGGRMNVADNCVDRWAEDAATADRAAIIWEGEPGEVRTVTYTQLRDQVARLANGLTSLGIGRGDVVAVYMQNVPEVFVAIHACNRIGAIYTVIFSAFSPDAIALRLQGASAKAVILTDRSHRRGREIRLLENLRRARRQAPSVEHAIVVARSGDRVPLEAGEVWYEDLCAAQSTACPCEPMEANEPAFLIFTSGTEARPKGLVHSTAGFLVGTWANVKWQIGPEPDDVYWCAADVGWLTFPIQAVIGGLAHGATLFVYEGALDHPTGERLYEMAERHGVTKMLTAPTALRMLRRLGDAAADRHPWQRLRLVSVQGEPLDPATFTWVTERLGGGVPVINAYGQTETGSTWTYPVYGVDDLKAGSCGRPVPGHHCSIVDDDGNEVADGHKGNLVLLHPFPTLARTIWDDQRRYVDSYFERFPGRYWTADEAVRDTDGHLWVLGRADDVINVAGHRISTMEIESVVTAQPGVAEGAVTGVADQIKGTVPAAFVIVGAGHDPGTVRRAVEDAVKETIGPHAALGAVYAVDALPKTRAGKIMRRLLREVAERGTVTGDTTGLEDAESIQEVLRGVRRTGSST